MNKDALRERAFAEALKATQIPFTVSPEMQATADKIRAGYFAGWISGYRASERDRKTVGGAR